MPFFYEAHKALRASFTRYPSFTYYVYERLVSAPASSSSVQTLNKISSEVYEFIFAIQYRVCNHYCTQFEGSTVHMPLALFEYSHHMHGTLARYIHVAWTSGHALRAVQRRLSELARCAPLSWRSTRVAAPPRCASSARTPRPAADHGRRGRLRRT